MNYDGQKIIPVEIRREMKKSYIDYAMSVIASRALPDVRDGLKPVHRRILYTMHEDGLTHDKAYRKSANVVGAVLGRYHPHGDASVYDALVRMAQDFSLRYPLIDGHGNFGSVDGDPPAAYRYTEARMARLASEMLADIDKDTIDFGTNYDDSRKEPSVLPSRFPSLLVNGSMGIAVGMATNIPPHNLGEVVDALVALIDDPECTVEELTQHIKGPDFPTGGFIMGRQGIRDAYTTGKGKVVMRARAEIEEYKEGRFRILVTEIPYMVNKSRLVTNIADRVKEKRVEGISDLRDESGRDGMKIVMELKRDANPQVVLNQLYKHTSLQENFHINMLALVDMEPRTLNLREMLDHYLHFQEQVIVRRTRFELKKALERAHILEGLIVCSRNIDEVVRIIRANRTPADAKAALMERFELTDIQAQAIIDMRLGRLTGLEQEKIEEEYRQVCEKIDEYRAILASEEKVMQIVRAELIEMKNRYGDERRSELAPMAEEIDIEDLIDEQDCVVTLTHFGYIKRTPTATYRAQHRGGRGVTGLTTREEDFAREMFISSTHSTIFFFTNKGRVYRIKCYEIPESGRAARGTNAVNLLPLEQDEQITAMIPVREYVGGMYLTMITRKGIVKRTAVEAYDTVRKGGLIALVIDEGDELTHVSLTDGEQTLILVTRDGYAIRFSEQDVRPMGRKARGVRGIRLRGDDYVVQAGVCEASEAVAAAAGRELNPDSERMLLTVTRNGYGKRTSLSEFKIQSRGGKGMACYRITKKTGLIAGIAIVTEEDDLMLISSDGVIIRMDAAAIPVYGRVTQGVIVMRMGNGVEVINIARADKEEENGNGGESPEENGGEDDSAEDSENPGDTIPTAE